MIKWIVVEAENIRKIGHDETKDKLYIDFGTGKDYAIYGDVSSYAFSHFVTAESIDEHYQVRIKAKYAALTS